MCNLCLTMACLAGATLAFSIVGSIIRSLSDKIYWTDKEEILRHRQEGASFWPFRKKATSKEILKHSHYEWHCFLNNVSDTLWNVLLEAAETNPLFIYCTYHGITFIFSRPDSGWPAILAEATAISNARVGLNQDSKKRKGK